MGTEEAIEPQEEVVIEPTEAGIEESSENGEDTKTEVALESDVFLDGDEGSQPDKQSGIRKRINSLNAKKEEALAGKSEAENEAYVLREQNKILRMAADQRQEASKKTGPPDSDEYDDGVMDAKYIQDAANYQSSLIRNEVQRQTSHLSQQTQNAEAVADLEKMQTKHYERAAELNIKGFEEVEDVAIGILGKEITNAIINDSDDSHLIMFYLGKNPKKAAYFAELAKTKPLKATLEIGALVPVIKDKIKSKSEPAPDPDEELTGGSPSAGQSNKHQRLVDKARAAAQNGGNMKAVMDAKKAAKEAGVNVV